MGIVGQGGVLSENVGYNIHPVIGVDQCKAWGGSLLNAW